MVSTSPNPAYIFLPIFIAKNLRFPSNPPVSTPGALVAAVKIKLDHLRAFFRGRKKPPFLHRILAGLHQQRMAADHARTPHTAVWRDDHFDLDLARNVHAASQFGIGRRSLALDLALSVIRVRLLRGRA